MVTRISGAVPILTLKGEQIAQPGVIHRITQAIIFSNGHVALSSSLGETSCTIALPSGISETALTEEYFPQVYWVAYQSLGKGEYRLTHNPKGLGGGNGVSTGKPGTKPLSGNVLKYYKEYYKVGNKNGDLDGALLDLIDKVCCNGSGAKPGKIICRTTYGEDLPYSYDWVESLLKAGANPDVSYQGKSLLAYLCKFNHPSILDAAEKLIAYGADVTICPDNRSLLEHFAKSKKTCELILRMAKSKGIDLEARDHELAAKARDEEARSWQAKAQVLDKDGQTALDKALAKGAWLSHLEVQGLLSGGADILKGYPLHAFFRGVNHPGYTLGGNDLQTFDLLLSKKPNLNLKDANGVYPLELACQHVVLFDRLIKAGADITDQAIAKAVFLNAMKCGTLRVIYPHLKGHLPLQQCLHPAFRSNNLSFVQEAVAAGVSVDYVDAEHPETCLQVLCRNYFSYGSSNSDREAALKMLLDLKADATKVDWEVYLKLCESIRKLIPELWKKEQAIKEERYKRTADALTEKIIIGLSGNIYSQLESVKLVGDLKQFISKIIFNSWIDYLVSDEDTLKRKSFVDLLIPAVENLLNKKTYFDPNTNPPFLDLKTIKGHICEKIEEHYAAYKNARQEQQEKLEIQQNLARQEANQRQLEEEIREQAQKKDKEIAQLQAALLWKDKQDREQREKLQQSIQQNKDILEYAASQARSAAEYARQASLPKQWNGN